MKSLLKGKNALITGGNAGIGKAIAKRFVEAGASVAIFGTNKERGEEVVGELTKLLENSAVEEKGKVLFLQVDVANNEAVQEGINKAIEELGSVDVLVNNAGITRDNLILKMKEEEWDDVMSVNLKSLYNTCKALTRPMMRARKGKIINITSVVGLTGNAGQVNYASSKAGVIGFTKSLAKELAPRNICVNAIAPGYIETKMTAALNDTQKEGIMQQIPMKRMGKPEEVADAALFLASELADFVTGQTITVDGGMVM